MSDENGFVILKAPRYRNIPYTLNVIYDGFIIESDEILFGLINRVKPYKDTFLISLYDLKIHVLDKLGLPPDVNINPILTSKNMMEQNNINAEVSGDGEFLITRLYPEEYSLKMSYKSFEIEQKITINNNKNIDIEFPAEYDINLFCMNSFGGILGEGKVVLEREGKKISEYLDINGLAEIKVPPATYLLSIDLDNEEIAKQNIKITGDKDVNILSSEGSSIHTSLTYIGLIIILLSIVIILWKKNIKIGLKIFTIGLIVIAIFQPWWILNGDDGSISTSTNTYIIPSKIITITKTQSIFGGEISLVPEEFTMILELLSMILILAIIIVIFQIFTINRFRKIHLILSILTTIILLISIILFIIAMSEVTKVGVGSFSGGGDLSISIPGLQENAIIKCNWGFGVGIYIILISFISNIALIFPKIFNKVKIKL
jgi:hypothetical protein